MTQELESVRPWASAKIFPWGGNVETSLILSGCWRYNTNWRTQNALSFLPN